MRKQAFEGPNATKAYMGTSQQCKSIGMRDFGVFLDNLVVIFGGIFSKDLSPAQVIALFSPILLNMMSGSVPGNLLCTVVSYPELKMYLFESIIFNKNSIFNLLYLI